MAQPNYGQGQGPPGQPYAPPAIYNQAPYPPQAGAAYPYGGPAAAGQPQYAPQPSYGPPASGQPQYSQPPSAAGASGQAPPYGQQLPAGYGAPQQQPAGPYGAPPQQQPGGPYGAPPQQQPAGPYGASPQQQPGGPYGAPPQQPPGGPYGAPPQQPHAGAQYGQAPPSGYAPTGPPQPGYGGPAPGGPGAPGAYAAPMGYQPSSMGTPPGRKKALLVGCSYPGTQQALKGCINDVECIKFCIKKHFGFQDSNIVMLRDDVQHPDFLPTKANILRAISWLVGDQRPGDSLFFHFSGHGNQKIDRDGDEDDGYDETIVPTDYKRAGEITDDELNRVLIRPLLPGVKLHAVIDACHSGTALDLPFRTTSEFSSGKFVWKGRANPRKSTSGGFAVQLGACKDSQTAADTNSLSGSAFTGAATFSFIHAIESYPLQNQTYASVLDHMKEKLQKMQGGGAAMPSLPVGGGLLGALIGGIGSALGMSGQAPKLSSDRQFDLYSTPFMI